MGSLMDGIEVPAAGAKGKASKAAASGNEAGKTIKLVIAIACLLIGGALIVWNLMPTPAVVYEGGAATASSSGGTPQAAPGPATSNASTSSSSSPAPVTAPTMKRGPQTFTR